MAILRAEAHDMQFVINFLNLLIPEQSISGIQLLGPMPAPLEKIAGKFRYQIHIQSENRTILHQYLVQLVDYLASSKLAAKIKWSLDVDPIDLA
jgi:primosomal protein N' (replication factor Y)